MNRKKEIKSLIAIICMTVNRQLKFHDRHSPSEDCQNNTGMFTTFASVVIFLHFVHKLGLIFNSLVVPAVLQTTFCLLLLLQTNLRF